MELTVNDRYKLLYNNKSMKWITFVHGFTHDNEYFMNQVPNFIGRYNILLINLIGHGERYKDEGPFNLYRYSMDILNIFNEVGISKTIYWGTHTGAACGLLLACNSPSYIDALILEGTPVPGIDIPSISRHFQSTRDVYINEGLKKSMEHWFHNSVWFKHMNKSMNKELITRHYKMLSRYRGGHFEYRTEDLNYVLLPMIPQLKTPCLMYNGEYDAEDFLRASEEVHRLNSNISVKTIMNTGGFPSWEDCISVRCIVDEFIEMKLMSN